jgi:hypothetical protein
MTSQSDGGAQAPNTGTGDDYGFHDDWFSVRHSKKAGVVIIRPE